MPKPMAPEGTVVLMQDGSYRVKRGGQWIDAGNLYVGPGPKLDPQERKQLGEVRMQAEKATGVMQDVDRFMSLNKEQPSGGLLGLPIVRDVQGLFDPEVSEMNAINNRLTPAQREPGSGAMSNADVAMYRSSVIGYDKPGSTNSKIGARTRAGALRQKEYAAFLDYYARVNGTINGAQEQWDEYKEAEPVYEPGTGRIRRAKPWREYFSIGSAPKPRGVGASPGQAKPPPAETRPASTTVKVGRNVYEVREK